MSVAPRPVLGVPLLSRALAWALAVGATAWCSGCEYDIWSFEKEALDPESASAPGSDWQTYDCANKDPLQIEIGQGDQDFEPIAPGGKPVVHLATGFQGGGAAHVFGGVKVKNPDAVHRKFRLEFNACSGSEALPGGYDPDAGATDGPKLQPCVGTITRRLAAVGESMTLGADGALSRGGIQVFLNSSDFHWIQLDVRDQCNRTASDRRP